MFVPNPGFPFAHDVTLKEGFTENAAVIRDFSVDSDHNISGSYTFDSGKTFRTVTGKLFLDVSFNQGQSTVAQFTLTVKHFPNSFGDRVYTGAMIGSLVPPGLPPFVIAGSCFFPNPTDGVGLGPMPFCGTASLREILH
jgi:hypothetical protein